jgi:rhodanese-related sulfurtransferase
MSGAIALGLFQFENLVRNRIPFILLTSSLELVSEGFGPMEKMHLQNHSVVLTEVSVNQIEESLRERHATKDSPIVVLLAEGSQSEKWAETLAQLGYKNIYYHAK